MEFTLFNKVAKLKNIFFLAIVFFLLNACNKSDSDSVDGKQTTVKVKLSVGSPEEENILVGSNKKTTRNSESKVQLSTVKVGDGLNMDVMVIQDDEPAVLKSKSFSNGGLSAAAQTIITELTPGVKYRVVVYDNAGLHKGNFDYVYGNEAATPGIPLNAGESYTFVVYSINSNTTIPSITNQGNLSTASLNSISDDLMFFKKTVTLTPGINDLSAVLVHQFSQITTTIEMDASMTGSIEQLSNTKISPTKANGSLKFNDGTISYPTTDIISNVTFPAVTAGARSIVSNPAFLISPTTTTAKFLIGSISLDAETKSDISVPNIKIKPGYKYNLVLKFRICTQNVTSDGLNWSYPETSWTQRENGKNVTYRGIKKDGVYIKNNDYISNTFNAPQANYGFQFDIVDFDNAFNMKVNNQFIFGTSINDQIQFQTNPSLGTVRNIQFVDGTEYATNGINEVYDMLGTYEKPLIRIMISRTGEVTMLGSKTSGGPLVPLKLKGSLTLNNVNWNPTGSNTVVVSQKVDGRTVIIGKGYGRKRIACP